MPPLPDAVASHAVKALLTAVCVWQAAVDVGVGQVIAGVAAIVTVKQLLFAVHANPPECARCYSAIISSSR
jgi:hypothetical protein